MFKWLTNVFWTESLWLAPGYTWEDVANGPDKNILYPDVKDFIHQIRLTVLLLVLRYLLIEYCFVPLGRAWGVKQTRKRKLQQIPLLESAYRYSSHTNDVIIALAAKRLDMTQRQVERWWRNRRQIDRPLALTKFCEHCWNGSFITCISLYGFYVLWDKDWFWDLKKCFEGYPHQGLTNDVWWQYMLCMAFAWTSLITDIINDVKRKDYGIQILHHILELSMMFICWMASLYRIGSTAMAMLDCPLAVLELAKAMKKTKYDQFCKPLFFTFTPLWFYTRLYYLPVRHIYSMKSALVASPILADSFLPNCIYAQMPAAANFTDLEIRGLYTSCTISSFTAPVVSKIFCAYVCNTMLVVVMAMSLYWTLTIIRVIYNYAAFGVEHDVRSSSSEVSDDEIVSTNGHKNGITLETTNGINGNIEKNSLTNGNANKNGVNDKKLV